ncbi:ABC transporter permease [Aquibium sp. ELW1220]|uniref:ABC transporter permease n=1 Tax=Aquibium sp. ELW1220 TaxID=2976766 RepID=UPI0025B0DA38|nr:ABC transporter permease [Aquibium sp. ELW1220]MDN2581807.1 ABC transporter permease [Aquibium sp. ELW1220]
MTDRRETWLFLLPGLALLVVGFIFPIARMLVLSVQGPDGHTVDQFARFFQDTFYPSILWRTVYLSALITAICAAIGFPLAYIMARSGPRVRLWLVIMVILPLMTSVVVRTFGWMVLLSRSGLIASTLRDFGLVGRSFQLMHTETAIVLGMVQVLLPFMVLSLLGVIIRLDPRLEEAARTMGCSFLQTMRRVVLPLAAPGLLAGSILVFTLSASSFVTPALLGGPRIEVLAGSIYKNVTQTLDWNFAAAQAVILFAGIALLLIPYLRLGRRAHG